MSAFGEGYEYFRKAVPDACAASPSAEWVESVDEQVQALLEALGRYQGKYQDDGSSLARLAGFVAEDVHAGTFNIDAALKGSSDCAWVPLASPLGSADVETLSGFRFQLKYDGDAANTARDLARTYQEAAANSPTARRLIEEGAVKPSDLLYGNMGLLGPSDQMSEVDGILQKRALKDVLNRPEVSERYAKAHGQLTDRVANGEGVFSKPLSKAEAREIALEARDGKVDARTHGLETYQQIELEEYLSRSLNAGLNAAAMAAILAAAPGVVEALRHLCETGEIDLGRICETGVKTVSAGARAFVTGSLTSAIAMMSKSNAFGGLAKGLTTAEAAALVAVATDAVFCSIRVAAGSMAQVEMVDQLLGDVMVSAFALGFGALGGAFLPGVGYLIGSFVGSAVGGLAKSAGREALMSYCVNTGVTFFGLVERDYSLPEDVLNELGIAVVEPEWFEAEGAEPKWADPEWFASESHEPALTEFTVIRRGVVRAHAVGYEELW